MKKQKSIIQQVKDWEAQYEKGNKDVEAAHKIFQTFIKMAGEATHLHAPLPDSVKKQLKKPEVPMFAVGNNELENMPDAGTHAECPGCGKMHEIKNPTITGSGDPSKIGTIDKSAGFISCPKVKKDYLVMLKGKLLFGKKNGKGVN